MTPSDELFQLIKSLTPSEKRYFKIHASKHVIGKSNHYEKLFDAIDVLPDDKPYDEAAFKKSLRGKSYGTHLSDEKSHLREMILRAMRVYHAERTPKGQLVEMIHEISFLYSKGFVKSCQQMIDKAMKLAEETEQYTEMLVLNDFLINLYKGNPVSAPFTVAEIEHKEKDLLDRISATRQAVYLQLKMWDIQSQSHWKEKEAEAKVYMETATKLAARHDLPIRAAVLLLNARHYYLMYHHRYREALDITGQQMELLELKGDMPDHLLDHYRTIMANYLMCAMHCEEFGLMLPAIAKLKDCKGNNEREEADTYRLATQYELIYLLNSADLVSTGTILQQIEHGLKKYKRFIPEKQAVNFQFNVALLHFLGKDHAKALRQFNAFYELCGRDRRYDYMVTMSRTMEWMCQSAMGNHDILDSSLRNLRRHVEERKIKHEFFDQTFRCFDMIIKAGNKRSAAIKSVKESIVASTPPVEWDQMKAIVLAWL